jgi:hypothetical protein
MGGGLMQLVAYGAQDIYLTGNPQITFFKVVYRRHTNFSMEAIEQTLNGTTDFGGRCTATISRNGDLVHRMYWEWKITTFDTANNDEDTCANLGSAVFKEMELEIGGQKIDKHYGHWLEAYAELTESNPAGKVGQEAVAGTLTNGTLFQNMSGMGGVEGVANHTADQGVRFTPLQFWFCRNPGLALPLIALQYHEVKLITEFESRVKCVSASTSADSDGAKLVPKLYADYIYLDTDERRRFAQVSHEYLIEQLQFTNSSSSVANHTLNFNHPVKELIWTGGASANSHATDSTETGPSTHVALGGGTYQLKLNGHDRFSARPMEYFTRTQVWGHHTGYGGMDVDQDATGCLDSIAVYSFALKPEEHQPSGTCNFSRIDNAELVLSVADAIFIYAVNYNVLRIMSGMGGLAYSN